MCFLLCIALVLPPPKELVGAGVQTFGDDEEEKGPPKDPTAKIDALMSKLDSEGGGSSSQLHAQLVTFGTGLPALPKKLIARMLANEYVRVAPSQGQSQANATIPGRSDDCGPSMMQTRKIILCCYSAI